MTGSTQSPRSYDNRGRADQARRNRLEVLNAARRLFLEQGYAATTIAAIAREAGVSPEMVYKSFGTKAAVAKAAYDVTLVGDDEPIPMAQRPEFLAILDEPTAQGKLRRHAALSRLLCERVGPLGAALIAAARSGSDPALTEFAQTIGQERLIGAGMFVAHLKETGCLRPGLDPDKARDIIWTLNSLAVYELLIVDRGWTHDEYESWLAASLVSALAPLE